MIMASAPQPVSAKVLQIRNVARAHCAPQQRQPLPSEGKQAQALVARTTVNQLTSPPETLLTPLGFECMLYIEANPLPEREQTKLASAVKQSATRSHAGSGSPASSTTAASRTNTHRRTLDAPDRPQQENPLRRFQRRDRTMGNHPFVD
ncbi:hypothetical protein EV129_11836 [Rhizobium azibense]|uniref:Uncharacterized protein n=1 Tax=Rhizobium azibense TaxID=1136135 RepID=A0A4R3RE56_9HYPH|nr:hypothetical protein EV129_11836 [Rhizobium azibense]